MNKRYEKKVDECVRFAKSLSGTECSVMANLDALTPAERLEALQYFYLNEKVKFVINYID